MSSAAEGGAMPPPASRGRAFVDEYGGMLLLSLVPVLAAPLKGLPLLLGVSLIFVVPGLLAWFVVAAYRAIRRPARRRPLFVKLGMLAASWTLASAIISLVAGRAQADADAAVKALDAYHAAHGGWPKSLDELGLKPWVLTDLHRDFLYYQDPNLPDAAPSMGYRSTTNPFDRWYYHFDSRSWEFRPD